ncbi:MAG: FAD-dependent oxidoreductase [Patescibacteria group bacterium]|jgi:ferredoxin-NADP reductase
MTEYHLNIKKIDKNTPGIVILELVNSKNEPIFDFEPGQYVMISYKNQQGQDEDKHAFSIASSPVKNTSIRLGIRVGGNFTQGLLNLNPNQEIIVTGPYGNFIFDEKKVPNPVFIAGGIGITPFISALNYVVDRDLKNKVSLIYSTRTVQGTAFFSEISNLGKINPNISVLFSFTEEPGVSEDQRILYQRIDAPIIKNFIGNISEKTFFICGPTPFMKAMINNLLSLGVKKNQIKMEEFSMIPDNNFGQYLRNIGYALSFAAVLFTISFNLISKTSAASTKKNYNPISVSSINQAANNRLIDVQAAKNKALTEQISTGTQTVPMFTSAPTPVPMTAPRPRTRVS